MTRTVRSVAPLRLAGGLQAALMLAFPVQAAGASCPQAEFARAGLSQILSLSVERIAEDCAAFLPPDARLRPGKAHLTYLKSRAYADRPAFLQAARALDPTLAAALDGPMAAVTEAMLLADVEGMMANELPPASAESCQSAEEKMASITPAEFADDFEIAMQLEAGQVETELCASEDAAHEPPL